LKKTRAWRGFDSSTEFNLPSGGDRSPRCCLGEDGTLAVSLTDEEQDPHLSRLCYELRSTQTISRTARQDAGVPEERFAPGWLIDPKNKQVEIYRQRQAMEVLQSPTTLSGET